MNKQLRVPRELTYVLGMLCLPFAVSLMTKANLGLSMIAAPTYIISEKITFLTYGQTEYIAQGLVLLVMCLVVGKFKWTYLTSYVTAVIYGTILDGFLFLMRGLELNALWMRVIAFLIGMVVTSLGVALFMNTYLAPAAWDYFVRTVVEEKHLDLRKFKLCYDFFFLIVSVALTLLLFQKFIGITWGTLVIAAVNGNLIAFFDRQMKKHFDFYDLFPKLAAKF